MNLLSTATRKVVAAVAAVAVVGGGGAAADAATAGTTAPTAVTLATTSTPTLTGRAPALRRLVERADHVTVEVRRHGTWVTYDWDRGDVTAVSATSITLRRPDGQVVTFAVTDGTRVRGVGSESAIATGRPARVLSEAGTALRIAQRPAAG